MNSRIDFPQIEMDILQFWKHIKAFEGSLKRTKKYPRYNFYDGPAFATGLPHYGHILASVIKDIIPRYMSQTGKYVERRWGWDTHGVPIEFEIEKQLKLKTHSDIEEYGIKEYCDKCREVVNDFASKWESTITRLGRWVDFKHGYKTLDKTYMESVWWIFSHLHNNGLLYQGYKVMPYSSQCATPLSNFESNLNYKDVMNVVDRIKFKLTDDSCQRLDLGEEITSAFFVIETTTIWTLPCNMAICANPKSIYTVYYLYNNPSVVIILCKCALDEFQPELIEIKSFTGQQLYEMKLHYTPLFSYCKDQSDFRLVVDDYVTNSGTGLVHLAPMFGIDDYRVCMDYDIIKRNQVLADPFDANCNFVVDFPELESGVKGMLFTNGENIIRQYVNTSDLQFGSSQMMNHRYPHCWRSDTLLMYRAISCWFVNVTKLKDSILDNVEESHWVPETIRAGRFTNWIKDTVDWCISRNRYWGTPLPIWTNGDETIVIDSIALLEQLTNQPKGTITDLHRPSVDHLVIPSQKGGEPLKRVTQVFACWFESGSMPYASVHYPFSVNTKDFQRDLFPAEFIAEGIDQTRGWFYTLNILSTALFNRPAFNNVIVNGLILDETGHKMSKKDKNYSTPEQLMSRVGADALRLYLAQSKAVHAEDLKFNEDDIRPMQSNILYPLYHALNLLKEYTNYRVFAPTPLSRHHKFKHVIDIWMLEQLNKFVIEYHKTMSIYELQNIISQFINFIGLLSRKYINLNKHRLKTGDTIAQSILWHCLHIISMFLAPFAPFFAEHIYQQINPGSSIESVHWQQLPRKVWDQQTDSSQQINLLFINLDLIRQLRNTHLISMKKPISLITIINKDSKQLEMIKKLDGLLKHYGNALEIIYTDDPCKFETHQIILNYPVIGPKYGKLVKVFKQLIDDDQYQLHNHNTSWLVKIGYNGNEYTLDSSQDEIEIHTVMGVQSSQILSDPPSGYTVKIDTTNTSDIEFRHQARKVVSFINQMRKKAGLTPRQHVQIYFKFSNRSMHSNVHSLLVTQQEVYIKPLLFQSINPYKSHYPIFHQDIVEVFGVNVIFMLSEIQLVPGPEPKAELEHEPKADLEPEPEQ